MFHGLGPSGFLLLALAAAECSGKENVHLHPKWIPRLKPSLSPGLAQEPGSPKGRRGAQVATEALPRPVGSLWGREPVLQGHPASCQKTMARDKSPRAKGRATKRGEGGPYGRCPGLGPWERETVSLTPQ